MVNIGTDTISYQYDAHGRRTQQTLNGTVTNYLWDQFSPWGDVVLETDNSGSDVVRYVMGGTELLAQVRGSNVHFYLNDIQNSTRMLADATGTIDATYSYDAFGEIHTQTGTVDNDYLYTGQQYDALTDLYSLRARYYDPGAGRFLSRDTWAVNYQNPFELNRYVYTANNPATWTDPSGYFAVASNAATYRNTAATSGALFLLGLRTAAMYATIDLTFDIISHGLPYMDDVLDDLINDTITREGQIGVPELDSIWTDYINTLDMTGLDGDPDRDPDRDGDPDPEDCCPIPDPGPGDDENDDDDDWVRVGYHGTNGGGYNAILDPKIGIMAMPYGNRLQLGPGFYVDKSYVNAEHWAEEKGGDYILGIWMLERHRDNLIICPRPSNWWPAVNDTANHIMPGCDVETARYDPHPPRNVPTGSLPPYPNSTQWKFNAHTFGMLKPLAENNTQ